MKKQQAREKSIAKKLKSSGETIRVLVASDLTTAAGGCSGGDPTGPVETMR